MRRISLVAAVALAGGVLGWAAATWAEEPAAEAPAAAAAEAPAPEAGAEGTAPAEEEVRTWGEQMILRLAKGGWVVPVQIVLSVVGMAFVLERLVRLRRKAVVPVGLAAGADRLWKEGKYDEIRALCHQHPSTLGRIIEFIVGHRDMSVADLSVTAGDIGSRDLKRHLLLAYPLAVVATIEPLLGLLGTVSGMIDCFEVVAVAGEMGDASLLADGIAKALVTTLVGLTIAIPFLLVYHYLRSRISLLGMALEEQVTELLSAWRMKKE